MRRGQRGAARVARGALGVLLVGGLLAGCSGADMTMQQAAERADGMLDATLGAVVPAVEWDHDTTTSGSCTVTRRRTVTTVVSEQRRGEFLRVVEGFWKKSGYEITGVNQDKDMPVLLARTPDRFELSLEVGYKGQAFFDVTTPCVDESPVAAPTSKPHGPAYPEGQIPAPHVRSDFWSVAAPLP